MNTITAQTEKSEVFSTVQTELDKLGLQIEKIDDKRPWGGFFVISESSLPTFKQTYFSDFNFNQMNQDAKLQPKILIVAPNARLSWQYHFRRQEIWKVVFGPIKVARSLTDEQNEPETYEAGQLIELGLSERHRLIGADNWGIVAEIWQHTDSENLSNEEDIVRVQDDYGR